MNTLDELVHYCKESDPIGALLLTCEWGSGKTYMIEHDLPDALGPDYAIVRVSLFGVRDIVSLQNNIRQKWLSVCYPFTNALSERSEVVKKNPAFFAILNSLIKKVSPVIGNSADVVASMNILDLISIEPEFEDHITHRKRKAILVFDDMERCPMNMVELIGAINECCENRHFNTIILGNLRYMMDTRKEDIVSFNLLKEKAISQTILHHPDYRSIVHHIITERKWRSEEYRRFLIENEEEILDVFDGAPLETKKGHTYEKSRNLLTLIISLQSFFRIYHHLSECGIENKREFLSSYIPYHFCHNNGIYKDGQLVYEFSDEDVRKLYPQFSKERLFPSIREWIVTGAFDKESFMKELEDYSKES
ncbi:MAG: hypothetical protein IKS54_09860 [Erysipelotrichaceae bacterium]|nr:hypothetical protein [Erysipelotrichaceae bacterium]